ncbi:MAG: KamA family radical SAM protein [Clostridiales bacterium]|nr:KamA family radical SAM protein [Clostridiales bacterium]
MDRKTLSKQRSDELHEKGQEYYRLRDQVPLGTRDDCLEKYNRVKAAILEDTGATEDDWNNWRWQMRHRIEDTDTLERICSFSPEERAIVEKVDKQYRWGITPYYAAMMDMEAENDPIRAMSLPTLAELNNEGERDPSGEEFTNPAGIVTRRYPDRLILNVTNACSRFCRHCQRRRRIAGEDFAAPWEEIEASIQYVRDNPEVRDVLITGGDPLTLPDETLERILKAVREIPHVEMIRIGTRTLVTMPQRITPELVDMMKKYHPVCVSTQFNPPREITPESRKACRLLRDNGFLMNNQMVLLKGVNDDEVAVRLLNQQMLMIGVRPYYIFHAKDVIGTLHFQTTIERGVEILEYLQGNTSGLCIPRYIYSAPAGLGKIPMAPNKVVEHTDTHMVLRTWEGEQVTVAKRG